MSILAYLDQHSANTSAAEAEQQTYATKLTFWFTGIGSNSSWTVGGILNVQNASTDPVSDVEIVVDSYAEDGSAPTAVRYFPLGTLPPCTVGSWSLANDTGFGSQTLSIGGGYSGTFGSVGPATIPSGVVDAGGGTFDGIAFTDANAVTWQRFTTGKLERKNPGFTVDALSDPVSLTKQAPAPTCS